jgi:predicted dehydrogenase
MTNSRACFKSTYPLMVNVNGGNADREGKYFPSSENPTELALVKPRLGFLGVGWIGRNRMDVIAQSGLADIRRIADPHRDNALEARKSVPEAEVAENLSALVEDPGLDGIVIATPSALHAEQSVLALEAGKAVFCQKPLGRTAAETRRVVEAARRADRLLAVDLSYRYIQAMQQIYSLVQSGDLGQIFAVDLVFHNAYGPDKSWFYDPKLSGGGCVVDLGVHLVDLALWSLGFPEVASVHSRLFSQGKPITAADEKVEDFASASIGLAGGTHLQLSCSWNLPAGQAAIIGATFYGTNGGAAFKNSNGSFYDFVAERYHGTHTETLCGPPDEWSGRAGVDWVQRLAAGKRFDEKAEELIKVAEVLERIYGR